MNATAMRQAALVAALASSTATAVRPQVPHGPQPPAAAVQALSRFDGRLAFRSAEGPMRELHVVVRQWQIHGRQHIERFPERGFVVVHLHSGRLTTVINGKEETRKGGDFWVVPAGASMSVLVTSESALLETTSVM
jgi:quercetin dioxygenase-like cupin family protein